VGKLYLTVGDRPLAIDVFFFDMMPAPNCNVLAMRLVAGTFQLEA
jgi:hypothetical protein